MLACWCTSHQTHCSSFSQELYLCAEYDLGERFDLKAKYCDNGWVDEEAEAGKQVQRFFGFGKKKKPEDETEQGPQGKGRKKR